MESAIEDRKIGTAAAVLLTTVVLVWLGNGLTPWWPLMWLAPLPLFWYSLRSTWWAAAAMTFCAWLAGSASLVEYFRLLGMPIGAWLANFGGAACMAATGVLLFRTLLLRGAVWAAIVALPALWVSVDWLRYWVTPHGTAGDLAYTQLNFLPFLQLASLTGPWGMSFVLLLVPGAAAAVFYLRARQPRQARRIAYVGAAVMLAVLGFGALRLLQSGQPDTVKVGMIASDRPQGEEIAEPGDPARRLLGAYAAQARLLASQGARVIVMPEKNVVALDSDTEMKRAIFQPLADSTGITIVTGELRVSQGPNRTLKYNRAEVYAPHASVASYDKQHMLPPFESNLTPGSTTLTLPRNRMQWGVAICKDMDYTSTGSDYARVGAGLMLIPAWDFKQDRTWHGDMAIMRGVESGFSVARAAKDGYLMVSDNRGRVIARTRSDSAPFATLVADVPVGHEMTLFQMWHDWFAWVAVGTLAMVIARVTLTTQ